MVAQYALLAYGECSTRRSSSSTIILQIGQDLFIQANSATSYPRSISNATSRRRLSIRHQSQSGSTVSTRSPFHHSISLAMDSKHRSAAVESSSVRDTNQGRPTRIYSSLVAAKAASLRLVWCAMTTPQTRSICSGMPVLESHAQTRTVPKRSMASNVAKIGRSVQAGYVVDESSFLPRGKSFHSM